MYSRIVGTGSHLPARVLTNADLEKMVDTTDEWIRERTGIERRHIAAAGETTVDLAEPAARRALEMAGVRPEEVDFIAFGTTTPDLVFPNCGVLLQQRLGARGGPAFSVEDGLQRLHVRARRWRTSSCARAKRSARWSIGAETLSRIMDWKDRATCVLFADGAGAVVLKPSNEPGVLSTHLHADGAYTDLLMLQVRRLARLPRGGAEDGDHHGWAARSSRSPSPSSGRPWKRRSRRTASTKAAIDWLVPHQANIRIIQATARKLDLPMERVICTVANHGNTSAASVPWRSTSAFATGASSPASCCCSKPSAADSRGALRSSASSFSSQLSA